MAMTTCPECSKEVSDQAAACPACGYPFFPDHDPEKVRYALYFAHELGMLYRKKKGNTYQLFPAGSLVEGSSSRVMGDD